MTGPLWGTRGDRMLLGRMCAGMDLLGRSGCDEVLLQYDDDTGATNAPVLWWAEGRWKGERVFSQHFPYPAQAVEDLLSRVVNGGQCTHCKQTVVLGVTVSDFCTRLLVATDIDNSDTYRYERACAREQ